MIPLSSKYQKALTNIIAMAAIALFCFFLAPKIILLFMPFFIGWLVAWLANPIVAFFERKLKIKRKAGSVLVIIAAIASVSFLMYWLVYSFVQKSLEILKVIPDVWYKMKIEFVAVTTNWSKGMESLPLEVVEKVRELEQILEEEVNILVGEMSLSVADAVGSLAGNIPPMIFAVVMSLLSAYFFVAQKEENVAFLRKITPVSWREKCKILKAATSDVFLEYIKAQFKIEIWIYLSVASGFLVLKVPQGFLIALFVAFFDILPLLGTGIILLPWAIFKGIVGDYKLALGLFVIWAVSQLIRQLIQPKVLGDSMGISSLPTLILLYIGYKLAGVAGMIGAVPIGILVLTMNKAGFFENCKNSISVLWKGFYEFSRFGEDDL